MKISIIFSLILLFVGCTKNPAGNNETAAVFDNSSSWLIRINDYYCSFDQGNKTMLFPIGSVNINGFNGIIEYPEEHYDNIYLNDIMVGNGENFNFGNINVDDTIRVIFKIDAKDVVYNLLFTTLPTVLIFTSENIMDDPKISSRLIINDLFGDQVYDAFAGIETRGGTSQTFPKVSYDIELWEDENGLDTRKEELFGLRNDEDWHLDAMYIDLSKSRNILGMETWSSFARANHLLIEENAQLSQGGCLVEVFHNNNYLGVYSMNEQIDRKQLGLKKNGGLLYKSDAWNIENIYEGIEVEPDSSLFWSGFELKHPEDLNVANWLHLYDLVNLVAYSTDETFTDRIEEIVDMENIIDYFLFINLIQANDNSGKNMFICRYDEGYPLSFVPWDLDLTFGNKNSIYTIDDPDDIILTNNLFDRLFELNVNGYRTKVNLRWNAIYHNNIFEDIINDLTTNINNLIDSNAGYRDNIRWALEIDHNEKLEYIKTWLEVRLMFFDNYINTNYLIE
tara:strand:- start:477 stop:2000 length:1524 start_codon:yes stop_codon:yes gene_type:complete